jgi:hypothetical protein
MGVATALSLRELVILLVFLGFLRDRALDRRGAMALEDFQSAFGNAS